MRITVFGHSENFKKLLDNKVITSYNIVTDKEKSLKPKKLHMEGGVFNVTYNSNFKNCFCNHTFTVDFPE